MSEVFYVKEGILSLKEMHEETNPLKLIKWHCKYNCCAGVEKEWKECNNMSCPLWVMRLGKNPNRKKRNKQNDTNWVLVLTDKEMLFSDTLRITFNKYLLIRE